MEGSETGSREGSDVACTEGICNHDETGMEINVEYKGVLIIITDKHGIMYIRLVGLKGNNSKLKHKILI